MVAGGLLAWKRYDRGAAPLLYVGLMVFMLGFLVWVARGSNVSGLHLQLTGILAAAVAAATFLIFGSLSGTLCERSGVVNIAIEGQFMFGGHLVGDGRERPQRYGDLETARVARGRDTRGTPRWVLAVMSLRYQANQIIVGIVIVAFCTAVTQFIMFQVLTTHQNLNGAFALPVWAVPFFSHIPDYWTDPLRPEHPRVRRRSSGSSLRTSHSFERAGAAGSLGWREAPLRVRPWVSV